MNSSWRILISTGLIGLAYILASQARAATVKTLSEKPKAFFLQSSKGLFEGLDLKKRRVQFSATDIRHCGESLERTVDTLSYSCTISLARAIHPVQLRSQLSSREIKVPFGRAHKVVRVQVSSDGRRVTFTTKFDDTGLDYEIFHFNDDFFPVYSKVAHMILEEAMQEPLLIETLDRS